MKTNNKVFVVTGAGSGMGRELTIQLVKKGAKVAMVDINEKNLMETAQLVSNSNVSYHVMNIADLANIEKLPDLVIEHHGVIDGIINNAGIIQPFVDVENLDYKTIERVMNVNFFGTVYMTKTFLPHLLKRPEAHIVNTASMGGFIPFPGQTIYSASKAAVKIFTEGLYSELKKTNIKVTEVLPGAINTNITTNSGVEMPKSATAANQEMTNKTLPADKAASIIINAIEKNEFRVLVGNDSKFLDFLYRFNPKMAVNFIVKQMSNMKN